MVAKNSAETRVNNDLAQHASKVPQYRKPRFSTWLQQEQLQSIRLSRGANSQNNDILRCLSVRDAYPVGQIGNHVIKIEFLCKGKDGKFYFKKNQHKPTTMTVWAEAVVSGEFEVELTWDNVMFEHFRKKASENDPLVNYLSRGLDAILEAGFGMSSDIQMFEQAFFPFGHPGAANNQESDAVSGIANLYNGFNGDHLRVGYGSGMLGTTVSMLFSEGVRQEIRNKCGIPRNGDPAPKSRRIWQNHANQWLPLGWLVVAKPGAAENAAGSGAGNASCETSAGPKMAPLIPSDYELMLKELSGDTNMRMDAINSIRQRLEKLTDANQRANVAKAIKAKLGPREYRRYKHRDILEKYIGEAPGN